MSDNIKVVFHLGLHKTATTSFQTILLNNRDNLLQNGIYYPIYPDFKGPGHHIIAKDVSKRNFKLFINSLEEGIKSLNGKGIILFSSEKFENYLKETSFPKYLEQIIKIYNIKNIEWHACTRNQFLYLKSLYWQLSRVVLVSFYKMSKDIIRNGYYEVGGPRNRKIFIFDYSKFFNEFNKQMDTKIIKYSMEEFVDCYPGRKLLENLSFQNKHVNFRKIDQHIQNYLKINPRKVHINQRNSEFRRELNYTLRLFGLRSIKQRKLLGKQSLIQKFILKLIKIPTLFRLIKVKLQYPVVKKLFAKRFKV